jgi:2-dehydropantoate 2-reductase
LITEVVAVAQAEGIRLQPLSGVFDVQRMALPTAMKKNSTAQLQRWWRHALLLLVGVRYRRLRSSMLAAIERGRPPPIDFLNGEVVERARARGLSVPLNEKAQQLVWAIARGERTSGPRALAELLSTSITAP